MARGCKRHGACRNAGFLSAKEVALSERLYGEAREKQAKLDEDRRRLAESAEQARKHGDTLHNGTYMSWEILFLWIQPTF